MKRENLKYIVILAIILIGLYFLTRYGLPALYTPEWSARHIFWLVAIIVFVPALFGKIKFSIIAIVGYIIGITAGELFGGFQADVPPQYIHYGWLILILVFLASCIMGFVVEHRTKVQ